MGKGKGNISHWTSTVKPGTILFEMEGISMELSRQALMLGSNKLPCPSKFIIKHSTLPKN